MIQVKFGLQTSENVSELQKNKGHGFGLMNCKGIIDKYKKTNEIFRVCLFRIESELGKWQPFLFSSAQRSAQNVDVGTGRFSFCPDRM